MSIHGLMDIDRQVGLSPGKGPARNDNMPVGEKLRQQMNPDKLIEQRPGSVDMRSKLEQPGRMDVPEIDLTVERLRKSSSVWPELEQLVCTWSEKRAADEDLMETLGCAVRAVTEPKFAAAYARLAIENGQTPHLHRVEQLWKSAVWRGQVQSPSALLAPAELPEIAEHDWNKLAAASVLLGELAPSLKREDWQKLAEDDSTRHDLFLFCEQALAEGWCARR